jgi:hypothetical protein
MAPASADNTPGTRHKEAPLSTTTLPYALRRVHMDGTGEIVSEHPTFGDGWQAGTHAVHVDREHAYSLNAGDRRVARFCHHRLMRDRGVDVGALMALTVL